MYEVIVTYNNVDTGSVDSILCESKPSVDIDSGYLMINCGRGQLFSLNIDTFMKVAIKYPLPTQIPAFKYAVDIHYNVENEDTELLFSPNSISVDAKGDDQKVVFIKDGDNIVRIINGKKLRSVKVSSYSEANLVKDL
jgi:hypothetical protein